jgi:hypothetical protein
MADKPNSDGDLVVVADDDPVWWLVLRRVMFVALAAALAALGVARATGRHPDIDEKVLYFLVAAGLVLMLERVTEFSVGKDGVSAKLARQAIQLARANRKIITGGVGGKPVGAPKAPTAAAAGAAGAAVEYPDDPQKGKFGGQPKQNGWAVSARSVRVLPGELCEFTIRVARDATAADATIAEFHLHDTFHPQTRTVPVTGGVAELTLVAYGAFTVGVNVRHDPASDPVARLELDLAEDSQFPKWFRDL